MTVTNVHKDPEALTMTVTSEFDLSPGGRAAYHVTGPENVHAHVD